MDTIFLICGYFSSQQVFAMLSLLAVYFNDVVNNELGPRVHPSQY